MRKIGRLIGLLKVCVRTGVFSTMRDYATFLERGYRKNVLILQELIISR